MRGTEEEQVSIGIDRGGSKIALGVVNNKGEVLSFHKMPTGADRGPGAIIEDIIGCVNECLGIDRSDASILLGIAMAGQIDSDKGVVRCCPNLPGWEEVPIRKRLEDALGLRVAVANDVQIIAVAEWRFGAGRGCRNLLSVFVGSGIGSGAIVENRLLKGHGGCAAEIGHTHYQPDGRSCRCGANGCLEAYAGGLGIARRAREIVAADPEMGAHLSEIAGSIEEIDARSVGEAYTAGDRLAGKLVDETAAIRGVRLASAVNLLNPQRLI